MMSWGGSIIGTGVSGWSILHRQRGTNSGSPVSDRWTRSHAHEYWVPIPSRRENNAGRTRTATSDSPPHCRSSLANSRRSNETVRNRDKRYRRSTLENPGRLGRLRRLPLQRSRVRKLENSSRCDNSGRRGRITGRLFVEVVNFIQTAVPWAS